jgi:hypothetical protein
MILGLVGIFVIFAFIAFFIAVGVFAKKMDFSEGGTKGFFAQFKIIKKKLSPTTYWLIVGVFAFLYFGNIIVRIYNVRGG